MDGGSERGKELGAVVGLGVSEDAEDGVQEFAHDSDESLHLGFAASNQEFVEGAQMRIVLDGDESGHEQSAAQVTVPGLADASLFVN